MGRDFKWRKEFRKEYFLNGVFGKKKEICTACNGNGHYDRNGSPECSCCNGVGYTLSQMPKFCLVVPRKCDGCFNNLLGKTH